MASQSLTLADSLAANKTFTLRGNTIDAASYIDASSSLQQPVAIAISKKLLPPGAKGNDRHYFTFSKTKKDAVTGIYHTSSCKVELSVAKTDALTDADNQDIVAFARNYLTNARVLDALDGIIS